MHECSSWENLPLKLIPLRAYKPGGVAFTMDVPAGPRKSALQRVSIKVPQFNEKYEKYMPLLFTMFEYIFLKYI